VAGREQVSLRGMLASHSTTILCQWWQSLLQGLGVWRGLVDLQASLLRVVTLCAVVTAPRATVAEMQLNGLTRVLPARTCSNSCCVSAEVCSLPV
jgi:hypothetical protein